MSKAIIIQQNGVNKNMSVDKLLIPTVGGGNEYWVPEESVALSPLTVTANGSYSAASAGKYGYDYVCVSVPGSSVTGKGSDGNTHVITKDPSTGRIVDTKVPSSLRIITPPDYIGPYGEGAYLSFDGLSVEALYADGTSAGVVPFSELQFPVTVAHYDPEATPVIEGITSDLISDQPVSCAESVSIRWEDEETEWPNPTYVFVSGGKITAFQRPNHYIHTLAASADPDAVITSSMGISVPIQLNYTYDGKTVYYDGWSFLVRGEVIPNYAWINAMEETAWTMIYGDVVSTSGGVQIPVQWPRTGDGLVLETAFGITVIDIAPSGTND